MKFTELYELTELEDAQLQQTNAQTGQILVQGGIIDAMEERQRVVKDPLTPYVDLDPDALPAPPPQEGEAGQGGGEGKEEGAAAKDPLESALREAKAKPGGLSGAGEAGGKPPLPFLGHDGYDPSERRAPAGSKGGGRWTATGASVGSSPTHSAGETTGAGSKAPPSTTAAAAWRDHRDDWLKVEAQVRDEAKEVKGLDPETVFWGGMPPTIRLNGADVEAFASTLTDAQTIDGRYYPANSIIVYGDGTTYDIHRVLSHEHIHQMWNTAMAEARREARMITDDMVDDEGVLKSQFASAYPTYAALSPYLGFALGHSREPGYPRQLQMLHEADGVTLYSQEHWREYDDGLMSGQRRHGRLGLPFLAINETLAEIGALDADSDPGDGRRSDREALEAKPVWRGLYQALRDSYGRLRETDARWASLRDSLGVAAQ
jgi:hypothetical protein